jgi:hypothetical protein
MILKGRQMEEILTRKVCLNLRETEYQELKALAEKLNLRHTSLARKIILDFMDQERSK